MCRCHITGTPLELVKPDSMRFKVFEPVLLLGRGRVENLDIRIRVKGGGHVSQIYGKQAHHASVVQHAVFVFCRKDRERRACCS